MGNEFERWRALFPVRPRDWRNIARKAWSYAKIDPEGGPHFIGHNPLAQVSYTFIYVVTIVMVLTGFSIYGQSNPGGMIDSLFGWVNPLMGGAQRARFWHHVLAWIFAIFIPIHIYLALRSDVTEPEGLVSSMFSGGKFVREDFEYEDE